MRKYLLNNLKFDDFGIRLISAFVLLFIAIFCLYMGSFFYILLILFLSILLFYELCKLLNPNIANGMLLLQLIAVLLTLLLYLRVGSNGGTFLPLIPASILVITCGSNRLLSFFTGFLLTIALMAFLEIRFYLGMITLIWLITCVIITDLAGYFVGRILGGPKIWTYVSPNKTWSGLIGGWVFAVLIGLIFKISFDLSYLFMVLSLIISISSQVGDFYESWLKRRVDTKDSSRLIPGHGGFMDRFDGFIGGALGFKVCLLFINPELVLV